METVNGMRNPVQVFQKIYDTIPNSYWNKIEQEKDDLFKWHIEDAAYKAPEQWNLVYLNFHHFLNSLILEEYFNDIDNNMWVVKVWSIFSTISEEEIIADIKNKQQK